METILEGLAKLGNGRLTPASELFLRSLGIYTQRHAEDGFFMVRIRIPGGDLNPNQLEAIASLADEHGRGLADITVRQNIQLHWVRRESLAAIAERLKGVGLSTLESGGGSVRNIVNCPVAGADENDLYDTTDLVNRVNQYFSESTEFAGMPRKLKVTISGCALRCTYPEIHDIGLFAERDRRTNEIGFRARIGGGLSVTPRFSRDLGVLVRPDHVVEVCAAIAHVFRDRAGANADDRGPGFQIEESEVPDFLSAVEERIDYKLECAGAPCGRPLVAHDRSHVGIHGQKTNGFYYVGLSVLGGRTSADALFRLAGLAREYGSGRIRTTNTQNIVLLDVPESGLEDLADRLDASGFQYDPSWSRKAIIACSGTQFCKQAIAETKARAADLSAFLESEIEVDQPIRISVTGCPNSCGQHQICDVGLEGSATTVDGVKEESFQILLGGGVGAQETLARRLGIRIPASSLNEALRSLFGSYKQLRGNRERFQEFCARHSDEELISFLSPQLLGISHYKTTENRPPNLPTSW